MNQFYRDLKDKSKAPVVVAEFSGNHNKSLDLCLEMVHAASKSGASAIKLQTYLPGGMTLDSKESQFIVNNSKAGWENVSLYDLYEKAYFPWEWHKIIYDEAKACDMLAFSSPFSLDAVDFLESIDNPVYKIASFENLDLLLIDKVIATKKPIIISLGMTALEDIQFIKNFLDDRKCKNYTFLVCTSAYPADVSDANLKKITHLESILDCPIGLSDHTLGTVVPITSVALGARMIEKHFMLSKQDGGMDSAFSLDPEEFKHLCDEVKAAHLSLGSASYGLKESEKESLKHRRSLFAKRDIEKDSVINEHDLISLRPAIGLCTKHTFEIIGKKAKNKITKDKPIQWSDLAD